MDYWSEKGERGKEREIEKDVNDIEGGRKWFTKMKMKRGKKWKNRKKKIAYWNEKRKMWMK